MCMLSLLKERSPDVLSVQDTQLQVKVPVSLQPIFMITHAITPDSPLYGKTEDEVNKVGACQTRRPIGCTRFQRGLSICCPSAKA